jgi:hypothetical protein
MFKKDNFSPMVSTPEHLKNFKNSDSLEMILNEHSNNILNLSLDEDLDDLDLNEL